LTNYDCYNFGEVFYNRRVSYNKTQADIAPGTAGHGTNGNSISWEITNNKKYYRNCILYGIVYKIMKMKLLINIILDWLATIIEHISLVT